MLSCLSILMSTLDPGGPMIYHTLKYYNEQHIVHTMSNHILQWVPKAWIKNTFSKICRHDTDIIHIKEKDSILGFKSVPESLLLWNCTTSGSILPDLWKVVDVVTT